MPVSYRPSVLEGAGTGEGWGWGIVLEVIHSIVMMMGRLMMMKV